jgi:hypothetical protein
LAALDPAALASAAIAALAGPGSLAAESAARGLGLLDSLEAATSGGAPLHHQIDVVRRWVGALADEREHERFGGTAHLRSYLDVQLKLLDAAVADYLRGAR